MKKCSHTSPFWICLGTFVFVITTLSSNFPMVWLHIRYRVALNIFIGLKKDFATISSNQSTVSCTRHSLPLRAINTHMDRKNIQKYILSVLCCCILMMVLFWLSIPAHWKKCKRISHWVNSLKDNSFKFKLISFTSLSLLLFLSKLMAWEMSKALGYFPGAHEMVSVHRPSNFQTVT